MPSYRGILFDLFGTLVTFESERLPELEIEGRRVRTTLADAADALAEWCPDVSPLELFGALRAVSEEMADAQRVNHIELSSRERFRRALVRVRCPAATLDEAAVHLSRLHMERIVNATVCPPAHAALLAALRPRYRTGVVTNFDDTSSAYDVLLRHGIAPLVDTVVVSEAIGLRKPHPAIVRVALRRLALAPSDVLFVGDTVADDVVGASAAGVDAAWIDRAGQGLPPGAPAPRYVLRSLSELASVLAA